MNSFFSFVGYALAAIVIVLLALILLALPITVVGSIFGNQYYQGHVESYFRLSDRASEVGAKLDYLRQYRAALDAEQLCQGQAVWFFQTPYTDLGRQCSIVDTLITRLESLKQMPPASLEYQQALNQITRDEYRGLDTCVFVGGWNRKSLGRFLFRRATICQAGSN